uniref:Transmembrane protein n=1 Tax=Triticum urartu TaxID=4572 RepID=A0A8R7VHQ3_TRIUA
MGDEVDAFSEELRRRPEVRIINKYAVVAAYVRITLKSIGALLLLWATVVLLGGFVSSMKKGDFWTVTIIAFVQAAGVFEAIGFAGMDLYFDWAVIGPGTKSWLQKCRRELNQLPMRQWSKKQIQKVVSVLIVIALSVRAGLVVLLAVSGPLVCMNVSKRARKQDHGIADGEAIKANMK